MADRTPRSEDTRVETARRRPWEPPQRLAAPKAPDGYVHRWIRIETRGQDDKVNVSLKIREGWEPVRADEYPNFESPTIEDGKFAGVIGTGGLILCRIPIETVEERAEYYGNKTRDQMKAVDSDLMKAAHPSMPLSSERKSQVSFGGKRAE